MPRASSTSSGGLAPPPFTTPHDLRPASPRPNTTPVPSSRAPTPKLHPSSFAPPFYNRPPTPLPPSPSLTSLLRPPFTPSRPTTPDSSDSEGITHSNTLSSRSARYAPKVQTYEYYGFTLYVMSCAAFLMYIAWSYSPAGALEAVGISYYPSRWWSLALPSYLVVVVCYIFVALAGYNTRVLTFALGALETVVDEGGNIAVFTSGGGGRDGGKVKGGDGEGGKSEKWGDMVRGCCNEDGKEVDWKAVWSRGTDAVMDVPIGGVCEVLYGEEREKEDWEIDNEEESWGSQGNGYAN